MTLACASGIKGLNACSHVEPRLSERSKETGDLAGLVGSRAFHRYVDIHRELINEAAPGLLDVDAEILKHANWPVDYEGGVSPMDSTSIIRYPALRASIGATGFAKVAHYDGYNLDLFPSSSTAITTGRPSRGNLQLRQHLSGKYVNASQFKRASWASSIAGTAEHAQASLPTPPETDVPEKKVTVAFVDFLHTKHQVQTLMSSKMQPTPVLVNGIITNTPEESRMAAIGQRKIHVTSSLYVIHAMLTIVPWIRAWPTESLALLEPCDEKRSRILQVLEAVKAWMASPKEYKAARRDGLLPKTKPYSQESLTKEQLRRLERRLDVEGCGKDGSDDEEEDADMLDLLVEQKAGAESAADASGPFLQAAGLPTSETHLNAIISRGKSMALNPGWCDAIIDRVCLVPSRSYADAIGVPRPHHAAAGTEGFKQAYAESISTRLIQFRTGEPLPCFGRICGHVCGCLAALVGSRWAAHPQRFIAFAVLLIGPDLHYTMRLLPGGDPEKPQTISGTKTTVMLPEALEEQRLATFIRLIWAWRREPHRTFNSGRRRPIPCCFLTLWLKELVLEVHTAPQMAGMCVFNWLMRTFSNMGELRASLVVRMLRHMHVVVDDEGIRYVPQMKQGSVGWMRKLKIVSSKKDLTTAMLMMIVLQYYWGDAVIARFNQRAATDPTLRKYRFWIYASFDRTVRGILSWEEV